MNDLELTIVVFESIKHIDENGEEFWYARELMKVLSYKDWRYFDSVIEKSKIACQNSELTDIDPRRFNHITEILHCHIPKEYGCNITVLFPKMLHLTSIFSYLQQLFSF